MKYREAIEALRAGAKRLHEWGRKNDPRSDLMGGRAIHEAEQLEFAANWLSLRVVAEMKGTDRE